MSVPIRVDASDVAASAAFLEQFVSDQVPEGDFSAGTALRDLVIHALASVVTFVRAEAARIRQTQSLVALQASPLADDPEAIADGAAAILSNFFVTPKAGRRARGIAVGHASRQVDIFVPVTARFTYAPGLTFVVDSVETLLVPAAQLVPIVDAGAAVLGYEFQVPLVAAQVGEAHNVDPGLFSDFDRFSPYVTRVEVVERFSGGKGRETVEEILARAPTAVSVRNLINERSIDATLEEAFDGIERILVIKYGDLEMTRDLVPGVSPHLRFHVGGMTDIYLRTAVVAAEFTGIVGGLFPRPDGVVATFRDASQDFTASPAVLPGDVLRVTAGLPRLPGEFLVVEVLDSVTLAVSERSPFPVATDEASPPTTVGYTIGRVSPAYSDIRSDVGGVPLDTGTTSRRISLPGRVTLPGGPVVDIVDIAILNPGPAEGAYRSTLDGFVHFPRVTNDVPSQAATAEAGLQHRTIVHSPAYAQSALQWMDVVVGTDGSPSRFDGLNLRVRYRTLAAFAAIDSFVRGRRQRVTAAFQLPRGHNTVVIRAHVQYVLRATARATLNDETIAQALVDFVNGFDTAVTPLDVSAIGQMLRNAYPDIAIVRPFSIHYDLRAPTGDVLSYSTPDVVRVTPALQTAGPPLDLVALGVTDRTLRYVATLSGVSLQETT